MKILFLSFYFRPDLCAGSFRATPLVDALLRSVPEGAHIDVITTQPNRYHSFNADCPQVQEEAGLSIFRIELPKHQSGMFDQSKAFLTFARAALSRVAGRRYDLVFATSSRLMTAVLGAYIARQQKAKLYLDIRDIFVDTIKDVLPSRSASLAKPCFALLERFAVHRADHVNLVSAGFADYFRERYPGQRFSFFTNGVDDEFLDVATLTPEAPVQATSRVLTVVYAGNIGEGQGLHAIVPLLAQRLIERIRFKIIGDGGRRRELEAELLRRNVTNVELCAPVGRADLLRAYRQADVLFMHLNDYDAFKKVLPSKVFEYGALGKPVWAGVSGYAAEFVRSEIENSAVFEPCDIEGAVLSFDLLDIRDTPRSEFVSKYTRANISKTMAAEIVALARA